MGESQSLSSYNVTTLHQTQWPRSVAVSFETKFIAKKYIQFSMQLHSDLFRYYDLLDVSSEVGSRIHRVCSIVLHKEVLLISHVCGSTL